MTDPLRVVHVSVCGFRFSTLASYLAALPAGKQKTMLVEQTAETIATLELVSQVVKEAQENFLLLINPHEEIDLLRAGLEALGASIDTEIRVAHKRIDYRFNEGLVKSAMLAALGMPPSSV